MIGDHTHVFWDCPKIRMFLENIKTEVGYIVGTDLEPHVFLLDPKDLLTTEQCCNQYTELPHPPTITQWKQTPKQEGGREFDSFLECTSNCIMSMRCSSTLFLT